MIRNQWYAVLESRELPPGKAVGVRRMGQNLVFWRDRQGKLSCLPDRCPHRGAALSAGKVRGDHLQCPFHGFEFDAAGRARLVPSNGRGVPPPKALAAGSYPVFEAHGFVYLWWGDPEAQRPAPRFFDNLGDGFTYGSAADPWKTHYSRVIENQLDVAHVPFVHHNTIGRGMGTLVDGPLLVWKDPDCFWIYPFNREDDSNPPRKPEQLSASKPFHLEFIFPNLWQNYISPDVRVVAAFAPVDDENTILYLRFYQDFIRLPLVTPLVNWLAMPFNLRVAHQDRVIVETQSPKRSDLKMGEKLVQADHPIIAYRRRRAELIAQTGQLETRS